MKKIRLLQTVETRAVFAAAEPPIPLNPVAIRGAYETCRAELEDGRISAVFKIPAESEIAVPDATADELVTLAYAELI